MRQRRGDSNRSLRGRRKFGYKEKEVGTKDETKKGRKKRKGENDERRRIDSLRLEYMEEESSQVKECHVFSPERRKVLKAKIKNLSRFSLSFGHKQGRGNP